MAAQRNRSPSAQSTRPQPNRRKWWRLWIYPRFQGMLLAINVALMALVFGLVGYLTRRSFEELATKGAASGLSEGHPYFQFLQLQYGSFCRYLVIAFALSVVLTSAYTLVLSHKLAGPIVRLKGFFGRIGQDGWQSRERVTFRRGDFFAELPELINRALERMVGGKS